MMTKHHKWDLCKHCSLSVLTLLTNIMVFRPMVFRPMVFRPMVFTTGTFHSLLCFIQTLHIFKMGTWVKHRNILLPKIIYGSKNEYMYLFYSSLLSPCEICSCPG